LNAETGECEACDGCLTCENTVANCKECPFGHDRIFDDVREEYRCRSNGSIGYSAVAVTGAVVGLVGGVYIFTKKKKDMRR